MLKTKNKLIGKVKSKSTLKGKLNNAIIYVKSKLQNKEITPNKEIQTLTSDEGYDGLNQVIVNPIPDSYVEPSGTLELTLNGTYDVKEYESVKTEIYGSQPYAPKYISFYYCTESDLTEEVANLDTSNITNMKNMFNYCSYITNLDLSNFNTSNVTDMSKMFQGCNKLENLILSNFNTSNVTDMSSMFHTCYKLTELDLSNFNTSNVTTMQGMFNSCEDLKSLNLSNFDISNVTNIISMFQNCYDLTDLDLSSFVGNGGITNLQSLCYKCYALKTFNAPNLNTTNVTSMSGMFFNCNNIESLDLSGWVMPKVTNATLAFATCTSLKFLDVRGISFTNITSYTNMLSSVPKDCEIIVMDDTQKEWFSTNFSAYTNVKTVAEYEGG